MASTQSLRERMLAVYHKKEPDRIPWAAYGLLIPRGEIERKLRNNGCGLILGGSIYKSEIQKVEISVKEVWEDNKKVKIRTYHTPLGDVFEKFEDDPAYHTSVWIKKFLISSSADYPIVKFIIENTVYYEDYDSFLEIRANLGHDGVILAWTGRSPWAKMLIELAGVERLSLDFYDNRPLVEDLLSSIEKKLDEVYKIAANSPAEVIWAPDNITGDVVEPKLFEKYYLPFYNKQGQLLHQQNKSYVVHMDGRLKSLKELIKKTDIDVVESFTFPEGGGDLPFEEARAAWENKSIIANLPAFLCFKEEKIVKEYIYNLINRASSKKNFMLEISEDLPHKTQGRTLSWVAEVMKEKGE